MEHVKAVLKDELERSERLLARYESEIGAMPRGSFSKKMISGRAYYYMVYRKNKKLIFKYLGRLDKEKITQYEKYKEKKAQYKQFIRDLKKQIKYLKKVLK